MSPRIQPDPPGAHELPRLTERLRHAAKPYSARELAGLTCHHPERVRRYLRGETPSVSFLLAICEVLGLSAEWLLQGQGPMLAAARKREATLLSASLEELFDALAWRWLRQARKEGLAGLRTMIASLDQHNSQPSRPPPPVVRPGVSPHRNGSSGDGSAPRRR